MMSEGSGTADSRQEKVSGGSAAAPGGGGEPAVSAADRSLLSVDVGLRNLAVAMFDAGGVLSGVEVIDVVSEGGKTAAKDATLADVVASLASRPHLRAHRTVVVETQPPKARSMRGVQFAVMTYFLVAAREGLPGTRVESVHEYAAKAKFRAFTKGAERPTWYGPSPVARGRGRGRGGLRGPRNYRNRKRASVAACTEFLMHVGAPLETLSAHKKPDDVADAVMQGVAFMRECMGFDPRDEQGDASGGSWDDVFPGP